MVELRPSDETVQKTVDALNFNKMKTRVRRRPPPPRHPSPPPPFALSLSRSLAHAYPLAAPQLERHPKLARGGKIGDRANWTPEQLQLFDAKILKPARETGMGIAMQSLELPPAAKNPIAVHNL